MRILTTVLLCLFVLAVSLAESRLRPVWYDEIYTASIARLERVDDIWSALAAGTDLNPPLNYLAVRVAYGLLGPTPLALRLPSALGYLLMSACLYRSVARWYPAPYAWLVMVFPLITHAFAYAFEGRPYGLLLGFSALALVCWQEAVDGGRRPLALVGLAMSLAAAVSTHYYGALTVVPLAAGEAVRTWNRRRVDRAVWVALLLGPMALLAYMPLLAECRKYAATFWAKPSWRSVPEFYSFLLDTSAPALMALLFLAVIADGFRRPASVEEGAGEGRGGLPQHDLVAAAAFAAMPAFAVVFAIIGKAGFSHRYALPAVIGVSLLVAVAAHRVVRGRTAPALVFVLVLLGWCGRMHSGAIKAMLTRASASPSSRRPDPGSLGRVSDDGLPIAVPHPHLYLESVDVLPAESASRLVFVSGANDTGTLGLRCLSRLRPLNVEGFASFLAAHKRFLVYDIKDDDLSGWMIARLVEEGAKVTIEAQTEGLRLYEVETDGRRSAPDERGARAR